MKKQKRPNRCAVLESSALGKHLWQFSADGARPKVEGTLTVNGDKPLPSKVAGKNWGELFSPRINVAWLPAGQVFLRVVQLPQADASEIGSMLEFQLEKLSPLPVNQIVWSFELVPSRDINDITAIVIIVGRDVVDAYIGAVEASGYQPDRIELPQVYQLVSEVPETDGVWIYPWSENGKDYCIAAWWFTGSMRHIQLIHLPAAGDRARVLEEQLMQTAWAGEMEGWLNFPVRWRVVAPPEVTAEWQKLLQGWVDGTLETTERLPDDRLAQFSAARVLRGEPAANLLPAEYSVRYRQQFVDRLWMRVLFAIVGLWMSIVLVYFVAVRWVEFKASSVQKQVKNISQTYTNTLRLQARVQVLQDQQALKYAALDCFKAVSDLLPPEMTLTSFQFGRGRSLELRGRAENSKALADFNDALRTYTVEGRPLFKSVGPPTSSSLPGAAGMTWAFNCELNREEIP